MLVKAIRDEHSPETGELLITAGETYIATIKGWRYFVACNGGKIRVYNQHHFEQFFEITETANNH